MILNPYRFKSSEIITSGLVHHFALDEGTGTTAGDSVGSADGTFTGDASWTSPLDGRGGYGLDTGTTAASGVTSGSGISVASPWSIAFFALNDTTVGVINYAIGLDASNTGIYLNYGGNWGINIGTPAGATTTTDDVTYHYVVTNNAGAYLLYKDGALERSVSKTNISITSAYLGRRGNGYGMDGVIDDVRIYNRVLTASEISTIADGDG